MRESEYFFHRDPKYELLMVNVFEFVSVFRVENAIGERDEIQAQFEIFKREIKHAEKANTAKEIRVLKKVVQNLEV